jgi:hypothetical protein
MTVRQAANRILELVGNREAYLTIDCQFVCGYGTDLRAEWKVYCSVHPGDHTPCIGATLEAALEAWEAHYRFNNDQPHLDPVAASERAISAAEAI